MWWWRADGWCTRWWSVELQHGGELAFFQDNWIGTVIVWTQITAHTVAFLVIVSTTELGSVIRSDYDALDWQCYHRSNISCCSYCYCSGTVYHFSCFRCSCWWSGRYSFDRWPRSRAIHVRPSTSRTAGPSSGRPWTSSIGTAAHGTSSPTILPSSGSAISSAVTWSWTTGSFSWTWAGTWFRTERLPLYSLSWPSRRRRCWCRLLPGVACFGPFTDISGFLSFDSYCNGTSINCRHFFDDRRTFWVRLQVGLAVQRDEKLINETSRLLLQKDVQLINHRHSQLWFGFLFFGQGQNIFGQCCRVSVTSKKMLVKWFSSFLENL